MLYAVLLAVIKCCAVMKSNTDTGDMTRILIPSLQHHNVLVLPICMVAPRNTDACPSSTQSLCLESCLRRVVSKAGSQKAR